MKIEVAGIGVTQGLFRDRCHFPDMHRFERCAAFSRKQAGQHDTPPAIVDHGFGSVDNTPAKVRLAFQLGLKSVIFAGANEIDVPPLDNINQFHKFILLHLNSEVHSLARKTHKKSLSEVVEDVKLLFYKDLTEQRQQPGQ